MIKHLYIHIPFCQHICHYCDFAKTLYNQNLADKYLEELFKELKTINFFNIETIYIGGGTPTALNENQLEKLLKEINFDSDKIIEKTIEINPETLNDYKIDLLIKYGVNRVSIGIQTTNDYFLNLLNRKHSFQQVKDCIDKLRQKGIKNITCDLMYSLPNQKLDDLKNDLSKIIKLRINHLSIYSLTIENNTYFKYKGYKSLDEEIESEMYELIVKYLKEKGFTQYEVANFTKDNSYSKHNLAYWRYDDFYGVGLGASGKINNQRYDNTRNLKKYLGGLYIETKYILSKKEIMFEHIMMSLRTIFGLDIEKFNYMYNIDFISEYQKVLVKHQKLLFIKNNHLICKDLGILNYVLVDFME